MKRVKSIAFRADEKVEADDDSPLPYIGLENIESWKGRLLPAYLDVVPTGVSNRFQAGNTLFGKLRPYLAKACNVDFDGLCTSELLVLRGVGQDRRFLLYLLITDGFISLVDSSTYGAKMPRASWEFIGSIPVPVPPVNEQRTIADFLDRETAKLDTLVEKKRALIDKLKEKRTALISRTVTHGLPPDAARAAGLDPHPKLKPSGIDWLGDVPEHWRSKRLKFELLGIEQGWSPQCDNAPAGEGEWGVLKAGAVNGSEFDPTENKRLPDEETPLREFEVKTGDFLVSRANTRELLGSAALVRNVQPQLLLCDKLYRLRISKRTLNPEFLLRFMRSIPGHYEFERDASGSSASMQNISQESVRNLWIPVPPHVEQSAIAEYLDRETAKIDRMVEKVGEAIARLQEYRTALITAAVTGKIDVRGGAL